MHSRFAERYGPWGIVAGASEGLGEALARRLSGLGLNLVLVARQKEKLERLANDIQAVHGVEVRPIAADLGDQGTLQQIYEEASVVETGLLVYNAAASSIGPFLSTPEDTHAEILSVNTATPTTLCHTVGGRLARRRRGGIVLMTSLSAFQGSALISTYAATKAYLLSLAEALSYELHPCGIDVLACVAGATRTPNYVASRPRKQRWLQPHEMDPDDVAAEALSALGRKHVVIPGRRNRISHFVLNRLLPRRMAVRVMGRTMTKLYGRSR